MSFGKFGAKPRGMSNPVYWVNKHLQQKRRDSATRAATERFNERWHRLDSILRNLIESFVEPLIGHNLSKATATRLESSLDELTTRRTVIHDNINSCAASELSKYATCLKKTSLLVIQLCVELEVNPDIDTVTYNSNEKAIFINGKSLYHLG